MKIRSLLALAFVGIVLSTGSASAGWGHGGGCYRGGGWGGGGYYHGGGWGGGGWGWGCGPAISLGFFAPPPVYVQQPVYVSRPVVYGYQGYQGGYQGQGYETSLLMAAQKRLARLGYYRGYVDGAFGPQTAQAVRYYQMDNGLPVTARLDGRTLASLGV